MIISPMTEDEIKLLVVHWNLAGTIHSTGTRPEDGRPPHPARIRLARMILTWATAQARVDSLLWMPQPAGPPANTWLQRVLDRIGWKEAPEGKVEP